MVAGDVVPAVVIEIRNRILQAILMAMILLQAILEVILPVQHHADPKQEVACHEHCIDPCLLRKFIRFGVHRMLKDAVAETRASCVKLGHFLGRFNIPLIFINLV